MTEETKTDENSTEKQLQLSALLAVVGSAVKELDDVRWTLIETDYAGDRLYGMDEWSSPVLRIKSLMERLELEFKKFDS